LGDTRGVFDLEKYEYKSFGQVNFRPWERSHT
jgi:hypothetical protein